MRLSLDAVEAEIARLWECEARHSPRMELMTLVALASQPPLLDRARGVLGEVARVHPSRTIAVLYEAGSPAAIHADVGLHRMSPGGPPCGDAIVLGALGNARDWLPEAVDRLALTDLPVWLWWVGDLPDQDDLFERLIIGADILVVDSGAMDLRDLSKLSNIVTRSHDRYAMADLAWIRLRALQDLIARFFDDEWARSRISHIERVDIDFAPRAAETDAASTQAALLFGWVANALSLQTEAARWTRGADWAEARLGTVTARFAQQARSDVPDGSILRVRLVCDERTFEIERQANPDLFRWSCSGAGAASVEQMLYVGKYDEAALFVHCLERARRDRLFETSLRVASHVVGPVAPRLTLPPKA